MKPLHEIQSFPTTQRELLQQQFGITSAEAFFEHATRNAAGVQAGLKISPELLAGLLQTVEGYLAPEFVKNCRKPVVKHGRGVIVD